MELLSQIVVGVVSGACTIWAHQILTKWRLKALEARMGKAEDEISVLQQRTAALGARLHQR